MTHIIKPQDSKIPIFDKQGNVREYKHIRQTFCLLDAIKQKRLISARFYAVEKAAGRDKDKNLPICPDCIKAAQNG